MNLAALGAIPDLPGPLTLFEKAAPHVRVELFVLQARFEHPRILADCLLARVAGDAGEHLVHFQNRAFGIGNRDAFARVRKYARGQPQTLLSLPLSRDVFGKDDDAANRAIARPPRNESPA